MRRSALGLAGTIVVATLAAAITSPRLPRAPLAPRQPVVYEPAVSLTPVASDESYSANSPNFGQRESGDSPARNSATPQGTPRTSAPRTPRTPRTLRVPPTSAGAPVSAPRTSGSEVDFLSDALFRQLDADRNGLLTGDEIPTAFRGAVNARGELDPETFAILFRSTVQHLRAMDSETGTANAKGMPTRSDGVPAWFAALDIEGSGQVSLHSWRTAGGAVEAFQRMDADGDGLLTRREVQTFITRQAALAAGTASARPSAQASGTTAMSAGAAPASAADVLLAHYGAIAAGRPAPKSKRTTGTAAVASVSGAAPATSAPPAPAPLPPAALPEALIGNDYWVYRNDQNLAALMAGDQPNVLFLGDSITDMLSNGEGDSVWEQYFEPLGSLNFAVAHVTTSHVIWQIETGQVAAAAPKVIVLLIGSNNVGEGQTPSDTAVGIKRIVDELGAQLPQTRVLLLGLLPRGFDPTDPLRAQIAEVNDLIAGLDDGERVRYLEFGGVYVSPDGSISPAVMYDGAHLTDKGFRLYADAVLPRLTDLLKDE